MIELKSNALIYRCLNVYFGHAPFTPMVPSMASIQRPSLGMHQTAERITQAAHIIRRIPSQQERERIMQQLEEDGDFNAEGLEAVRRAVGYSGTMR